jgi:hypothetical protein
LNIRSGLVAGSNALAKMRLNWSSSRVATMGRAGLPPYWEDYNALISQSVKTIEVKLERKRSGERRMNREKKTIKALATIVMAEIERHPELHEIKGVTIRHAERHNPEAPNWDASFESIGYDANHRPIPVPVPPPSAYEVVRKLQSRYDLA